MGRPKGSKDLKPRKKRVDKPIKKPNKDTQDKYLDLTSHIDRNQLKYKDRSHQEYLNEYNDWRVMVWTIGALTLLSGIALVFIYII